MTGLQNPLCEKEWRGTAEPATGRLWSGAHKRRGLPKTGYGQCRSRNNELIGRSPPAANAIAAPERGNADPEFGEVLTIRYRTLNQEIFEPYAPPNRWACGLEGRSLGAKQPRPVDWIGGCQCSFARIWENDIAQLVRQWLALFDINSDSAKHLGRSNRNRCQCRAVGNRACHPARPLRRSSLRFEQRTGKSPIMKQSARKYFFAASSFCRVAADAATEACSVGSNCSMHAPRGSISAALID
jgi:hypothetical protein